MKYKAKIQERIESSLNTLETIKHGLETRVMNETAVSVAINKAGRQLESTMELLDLESEE